MCLPSLVCLCVQKNWFEQSEQRSATGPSLKGFRAPITQLKGLELQLIPEFSSGKELENHSRKIEKKKSLMSPFKKKNHLFAVSELIFCYFLHFPLCLQNKTDETPPSSSNCCLTVLTTDFFSVCCKNLPLCWPRDWCLMLDLEEDLKAGSCYLIFSQLLN